MEPLEKIGVLIVDDHELFRRGLASVLQEQEDLYVVGEAENGEQAIALSRQRPPKVILMDVHMPGVGGIKCIPELKALCNPRILMLTVSQDSDDLMAALAAGADGYLLKSTRPAALCQAIRQVVAGDSVLSPEITAQVIQTAARHWQSKSAPTSPLSKRETEVLQLIAQGATNAEIAQRLTISEATVKTHVRNILEKMGAANRTDAVRRALALGIIKNQH